MKGIIYSLKSSNCDKFYLGSTISTIQTRFSQHKTQYKKYKLNPQKIHYCTSFKLFDIDFNSVEYEILYETEINNRYEILLIEQQFYEDNKDFILNKNAPIDTNIKRAQQQKKYQNIYRQNLQTKQKFCCPHCLKLIQIKISPNVETI